MRQRAAERREQETFEERSVTVNIPLTVNIPRQWNVSVTVVQILKTVNLLEKSTCN